MAVDRGLAPRAIGAAVTDASAGGLADRILGVAVILSAVAVGVQSAAHIFNTQVLDARVWSLSADVDGNVFAWASSAATFTAAFAALVLIVVFPERKRQLLAVAAIVAFFSLDDFVAIHEKIATYLRADLLGQPSGFGRPLWPIVFLPLMAAVAIILWRLTAEGHHAGGRTAIRRGLVLLVLAIFLEASSVLYFESGSDSVSWPDTIEVALEEAAELAGWILIAAGLLALAAHALVDTRADRETA